MSRFLDDNKDDKLPIEMPLVDPPTDDSGTE
jgi:hypothetical protein